MACGLALGAPGARGQGPYASYAPLPGPVPPAGAAVVGGPVAGVTVLAFDSSGQLCVGPKGQRSVCAPAPDAAWHPTYDASRGAVFGAVSADVASVEIREAGRRQTVATAPGAYAGAFAGRVRFFAAALGRGGLPYRLRMLDAGGRALAAVDVPGGEAPTVGASVPIAHGRIGGAAWRVQAFQRTRVAPTPLDHARTERETCLSTAIGLPRLSGDCATAPPGAITLFEDGRCDAEIVAGLAGRGVRTVDAILGDGTRRRLVLHALPARFGDARAAFALALGRGVALRSLIVRSARTTSLPVRAEPVGAQCTGADVNAGIGSFGFFVPPAPSTSGPLIARDDGDDLCVGLGTITPSDCRLPPVEPLDTRVERTPAGSRTAVLVVAPAQVTAVRLRLDSGPPLVLPTSDLPGYTGKYRGYVRAVLVTLPGDRRVYGVELLGADGRELLDRPGPDQPPLPHTPRLLASLPGGGTVSAVDECVEILPGRPTRDPSACTAYAAPRSVAVSVPCSARRTVVVARLTRAARGLEVLVKGGDVVRGRRRGTFAVALVPARGAVREIRLVGAARREVTLPPAAEQCGYDASVPLTSHP